MTTPLKERRSKLCIHLHRSMFKPSDLQLFFSLDSDGLGILANITAWAEVLTLFLFVFWRPSLLLGCYSRFHLFLVLLWSHQIPEWLCHLEGWPPSAWQMGFLFYCPKDIFTLLDWTTRHQGQTLFVLPLSKFPFPRECLLSIQQWRQPGGVSEGQHGFSCRQSFI